MFIVSVGGEYVDGEEYGYGCCRTIPGDRGYLRPLICLTMHKVKTTQPIQKTKGTNEPITIATIAPVDKASEIFS